MPCFSRASSSGVHPSLAMRTQISVERVKPAGTGTPKRAISASSAPLAPSRGRNAPLPSAFPSPKKYSRIRRTPAADSNLAVGVVAHLNQGNVREREEELTQRREKRQSVLTYLFILVVDEDIVKESVDRRFELNQGTGHGFELSVGQFCFDFRTGGLECLPERDFRGVDEQGFGGLKRTGADARSEVVFAFGGFADDVDDAFEARGEGIKVCVVPQLDENACALDRRGEIVAKNGDDGLGDIGGGIDEQHT